MQGLRDKPQANSCRCSVKRKEFFRVLVPGHLLALAQLFSLLYTRPLLLMAPVAPGTDGKPVANYISLLFSAG